VCESDPIRLDLDRIRTVIHSDRISFFLLLDRIRFCRFFVGLDLIWFFSCIASNYLNILTN
jgi:hypothetical protein